jgi:Zn-dependent protease
MRISRGLSLLRVAGIPIEINYSWILIFVLVTANLAWRWFPEVLPGRSAMLYYLLSAACALVLFICVLAHELSHSLVAKRGGAEVQGIVLHVFGGVSLISEKQYSPALEFRVAIAGPLLSIALGFVFWLIRQYIFPDPHTIGHALSTYLYFINIVLAVFNLLPGFPLDGGRVLRSLIGFWKKDVIAATRITSRIGRLLAIVFIVYGLFIVLSGNFWGLWTVLIGIFLKDAAEFSYRQVLMQDLFRGGLVRQIMQSPPVVVPPDITIQQFIDEYLWHHHYGSFPVGNEKALGILTFTDVKKIAGEDRQRLFVRDVMHPADANLEIAGDEPIMKAFEKASNNGVGRLIVVNREGKIEGYLSLRDIGRAFQQRSELTTKKQEREEFTKGT